jgi:hypothetical protein
VSTGKDLKKRLGLADLPHVYMARVLYLGPTKTYIVAYDSRRPNTPITSASFLYGRKAPVFLHYPFDKRARVLPFVPIEKFDFDPAGSTIVVVDTSGRFADVNQTPVLEARGSMKTVRFDEITLGALKGSPIRISPFTQRFRTDRDRTPPGVSSGQAAAQGHGPENRLAKLIDVQIDPDKGWVTFGFLTPATEHPHRDSKGETDPTQDFAIKKNTSRTYEMYIRILDFFPWLFTHPDKMQITGKDVQDVLEVADVQLFSTSPSFHWQGANANLSAINASIYPTTIEPRVWGPRWGGVYLLDKHLAGLLKSISFFLIPMGRMLTKRLREGGFLPRA